MLPVEVHEHASLVTPVDRPTLPSHLVPRAVPLALERLVACRSAVLSAI
ncbi:hypothetical protein NQZ70_01362 [Sorangium sp. Soce836]|nr:hypothetical protein NQZ70_01362 [Sorangium sp. Soce836]